MTNQLFEAALGIQSPWFVQSVDFDEAKRQLTIGVDFVAGSRFAHADAPGAHPVHDTQIKRLRHLNFFSTSATWKYACPVCACPTAKCVWSSRNGLAS